MFPDDAQVQQGARRDVRSVRIPDGCAPGGLLRTDFTATLGKISYHVPCHLRVQNIGLKTRDVLQLVPDTQVEPIERCSGHDGTYGVKREYREIVDEDRPAGRAPRRGCGAPISTRATVRWPGTRSSPVSRPAASRAEPTHPLKLLRHGLRNLSAGRHDMQPSSTRNDLMTLEQYARERTRVPRASARAQGNAHVALRAERDLVFEDRLTMQYQVQEMLRIERIFEADGIAGRARRLQPADPGRQQLEGHAADRVPGRDERRVALAQLQGRRGPLLGAGRGLERVLCDRRRGPERENDEKTSSVHFLRFELDPADVRSDCKAGARDRASASTTTTTGTQSRAAAADVRALAADLD